MRIFLSFLRHQFPTNSLDITEVLSFYVIYGLIPSPNICCLGKPTCGSDFLSQNFIDLVEFVIYKPFFLAEWHNPQLPLQKQLTFNRRALSDLVPPICPRIRAAFAFAQITARRSVSSLISQQSDRSWKQASTSRIDYLYRAISDEFEHESRNFVEKLQAFSLRRDGRVFCPTWDSFQPLLCSNFPVSKQVASIQTSRSSWISLVTYFCTNFLVFLHR